jgi:hypothetical protein
MSTDDTARHGARGEREPGGHDAAGHDAGGHDVHAWVARLADEFGVDPDLVDVEVLLDLSREAAHGVARPAVPLTGFFVGYAVATGTRDRAELDRVAARVTDLAREWAREREQG